MFAVLFGFVFHTFITAYIVKLAVAFKVSLKKLPKTIITVRQTLYYLVLEIQRGSDHEALVFEIFLI